MGKKCIERVAATAKVVWNEREALLEAIKTEAKRHSTAAQRYLLTGLVFILCLIVTARVATETEPPRRVELASITPEQAIVDEQAEAEAAKALAVAQEQEQHRQEAEAVARVLYGTALHNSREGQEAVVWCIINRCESSLFPDSIVEVCKQPVQWMGYADDNPVIKDLFDLANDVLTGWRSGGYRIISPDYLYMSWTADEIVLRTTFEETSRTHYWRA